MKIVLNDCYGGFSVSEEFLNHYGIPKNKRYEISRYDKRLIEYIETYGSKAASGRNAELIVEEIEPGTYYRIDDYDGVESIVCRDNTHWLIAE